MSKKLVKSHEFNQNSRNSNFVGKNILKTFFVKLICLISRVFFFGLDLLIFLALCYVLSGWWIFIRKKVPGKNIYFVPIQYNMEHVYIFLLKKYYVKKIFPYACERKKINSNPLFFFIFVECTIALKTTLIKWLLDTVVQKNWIKNAYKYT